MTEHQDAADIACEEVVELVTDYLEGALDPATARTVDAHLALCPGCDAYLGQMRSTISTLGRVPLDTLSDQAKTDLLAAFRGVHGS